MPSSVVIYNVLLFRLLFFQKIKNKHAAFLSIEVSSLGTIFDHAVFPMKQMKAQFSCISLLAWFLASRLAKSKGQLVVSADNIVLVTLRFFATSGKKENSQVEQNLLLMNRKEKQNLGSF